MASDNHTDAPAIETEITYLAPGSFINRRFVAPAREVNTGEYLAYPVTIRDARPRQAEFTRASHGFELRAHRSAVRDFRNKEEVSAVYPKKWRPRSGQFTGADRVATMSWMVRTSGELDPERARKWATNIRAECSRPPRRPIATPRRIASMPWRSGSTRSAFPKRRHSSAFSTRSFWRAFSPPPQDYPLALCDGNSVGDEEGVPNTLFIVDQIPEREEMLRPVPDEDKKIAAAIFHHNRDHRWWYFSNMTRDEVLLLVFHDSRRIRPWRVPHTAFHDTSRPDAHPRESIEFRSIAYFS